MVLYTIEVDVAFASVKKEKVNRQLLDGKQLVIRKKPHAIDVVFVVSIQRRCWYTM
jgi:hypothetical protein